MTINANKPERWKPDITQSIDFYNDWFMRFAPKVYRETRTETTAQVLDAFSRSNAFQALSPALLKQHPSMLQILRMATAPPIARDRLIGLAGVSASIVNNMERSNRLPPRMAQAEVDAQVDAMITVINHLLDDEILSWLKTNEIPDEEIVLRAATVIADRLCGAVSDPIIRNAQEQRQLKVIAEWLNARGYQQVEQADDIAYNTMPSGTFAFRMNIPAEQEGRSETVNIPMDVVAMPQSARVGEFPILIEAKSAGDFANTNKRRKEEATKVSQLRYTYGSHVKFILFLCGYFDSGYLGYEAAEGIDWVWEHRPDDLVDLGL